MRGFAPAKLNLALHVTGRRDDGYHLLDSLVVFAEVGDWVEVTPAEDLSLQVTGPRAAGVPSGARNLIWKAAKHLDPNRGAAITLEKHLPHAGGIGGGSADAAAAIRLLSEIWGMPAPEPADALPIGADVPICLYCRPARMSGIGEILGDVPPLPPLWAVMVNNGIEVPTGPVFQAMTSHENPPLPPLNWSASVESFTDWLHATRNDLQPPAIETVPSISDVLDAIAAQPNCLLSRMSGSGGTCFGLFASDEDAEAARDALRDAQPNW